MTNITETVKQAAREAVARELDAGGEPHLAADVRAGRCDDSTSVEIAILGALAALPVIRAEVVRECARLAQDEESRLRAASLRAAEQPEIFPGLARERDLKAVTAKEIMLGILALAEQEDTTR